jgi:hypothetical protein
MSKNKCRKRNVERIDTNAFDKKKIKILFYSTNRNIDILMMRINYKKVGIPNDAHDDTYERRF